MIKENELTISEIENQYLNEWVLVWETAWDEQEMPIQGIVIAHSPDREDLTTPTKKFRKEKPSTRTYTFFAGEKMTEGVVFVL
jgi:hypothetical protein